MLDDDALIVQITPQTRQDLLDIWRYSADTWSPSRADRYIRDLDACFTVLSLHPQLASERVEFVPPVRLHRFGSHIIVYRTDGDTLSIVRVLHSRQNWAVILGEDQS